LPFNIFRTANELRLSSWLFLKGLALIYLIAFITLSGQIAGLAGANGILPFSETLEHLTKIYGNSAWWRMPTVFWLNASDFALQLACYLGALLALMLLFGRWPQLALVGMFVLYLSLYHAADTFLNFQWDLLLLEAGFLAIFLTRGPSVLVIFLYEFLLFRFRFLSGFFKLESGDSAWAKLSALKYYFETQPLPHLGSWYFHQLPEWLLTGGVLLTFFSELIVPFFIFLPRKFRITAAIITIGMQLIIIASSNHNFVNLLVILLCLFLLDDKIVGKIMPSKLIRKINSKLVKPSRTGTIILLAAAVLIVNANLSAILEVATKIKLPDFLLKTTNLTLDYGIGHIYHIFPTMQTQRQELEIQGSNDGQNWHSYGFKYKPGPLSKKPEFNVPHQPRLDWMMWFLPPQNPGDSYWYKQLLRRLHQGSPQVLSLFAHNPFENKPPKYLRVLAFDYKFTNTEEYKTSGNWWKRQFLGEFPHVKPRMP